MAQNPSDKPEATGPTSTGPMSGPARWRPNWRDVVKRLVGVVAVIVAVWLIYLFLDAFLPRWWAQVIGNAVDGSFAAGAWWGLLVGAVFTVVFEGKERKAEEKEKKTENKRLAKTGEKRLEGEE